MASTYSTNLALELIGTGDQSGTWGTTTNTNLGTLLEQAISGYATQACTGGTDTITIPNGASGVARNMYLELTGTGGGTLVVPSNKKLYLVYNNTASAITVKVSGQTGVSVPASTKMFLVSNGTDIVNALNYFASLTLGTALPIASGGTGATSASAARTALSAAASGANSDITSLTALSTPLSVAQGGTGASSTTAYAAVVGNSAGTGFSSVAPGTSGNVLTSNGTSWTSATPASGPSAASTAVTQAGSSTTTYVTPGGLNGALGFSAGFTSSDQTITSGGSLTIAHGLGRVPILINAYLVCQSAEAGYTVGQVTPTPLGAFVTTGTGLAVVPDSTNLNVRFVNVGTAFVAPNFSTGAITTLTNANWKVRFYAFG